MYDNILTPDGFVDLTKVIELTSTTTGKKQFYAPQQVLPMSRDSAAQYGAIVAGGIRVRELPTAVLWLAAGAPGAHFAPGRPKYYFSTEPADDEAAQMRAQGAQPHASRGDGNYRTHLDCLMEFWPTSPDQDQPSQGDNGGSAPQQPLF